MGSSFDSYAVAPLNAAIAALIKTDTTLDWDKVCLLLLSAFQARFLNKCAVALINRSEEQDANCATIMGMKPE